jgi:hypothetical protein
MERIDVVLRAEVHDCGPVLVEVWYDQYRDGALQERLTLRREHADPRWSDWERTLFETAVRAQLALF